MYALRLSYSIPSLPVMFGAHTQGNADMVVNSMGFAGREAWPSGPSSVIHEFRILGNYLHFSAPRFACRSNGGNSSTNRSRGGSENYMSSWVGMVSPQQMLALSMLWLESCLSFYTALCQWFSNLSVLQRACENTDFWAQDQGSGMGTKNMLSDGTPR